MNSCIIRNHQIPYQTDLVRWTEKQVRKAVKNRPLFELQRIALEWVWTISAFRTQVFREKRAQSWPFLLTFLRQGKKSKWVYPVKSDYYFTAGLRAKPFVTERGWCVTRHVSRLTLHLLLLVPCLSISKSISYLIKPTVIPTRSEESIQAICKY